jgi:hypothetical protein
MHVLILQTPPQASGRGVLNPFKSLSNKGFSKPYKDVKVDKNEGRADLPIKIIILKISKL